MGLTIGFIGMGLMGGSIAKSIKKYNLADEIIAYNRHADRLTPAIDEGVVDKQAFDIDTSFASCDIIFLCCPIQINIQIAKQLKDIIKPTCILTDVGSTKNDIHVAMMAAAPDLCFIGGHPMTGSEKSGYSASDPQLFENICYVLAPSPAANEDAVELLTALVKGIKSIPVVIEPKKHDAATAAISHMPQVLSVALVNAVADMDKDNGYMKVLAAGGFRDMSRIAASSPDMWAPILEANHEAIVTSIDRLATELTSMRDIVINNKTSEVYTTFEQAKVYRETMHFNHRGLLPEEYSFTIDVSDEPGIIAKIAGVISDAGINLKNIGIINNREREEGVLRVIFDDEVHCQESIQLLESLGYTIHTKE